MLLLLFFSVPRSFSLPEFSFFHSHSGTSPCGAVLLGGLAALCLVSQLSVRSRGALLRRLGLRRCACDSKCYPGGLALPNPRPSSLHFFAMYRPLQYPGHWPCSSWGGRVGGICRGDRFICPLHQLGPPLCGPHHRRPSPRALRSGLSLEDPFQVLCLGTYNIINICCI